MLLAEPASAQVLAFASAPDGVNTDIWTLDLATGARQRLTTDPVTEDQPAWSFDGTTIAYRRGADVWTMNADGSGQRRRTHSTTLEWFPFWLRDGRLGFTVNRGTETTEEMYVLGPGDTPISLGLRGRYASVSPDGQWICYTTFDGVERAVVLRRLPLGKPTVLAVNGIPAHSCAWSPFQPQRLVFHSHHALLGEPRGNGRLFLADTTGWIGAKPFTQGPPLDGNAYDPNSGDFQPTWSKSGWLVWSRPVGCGPPPTRCGEQLQHRELYAKLLNGPEIRLTTNGYVDWYPSFRP